MCALASFPEEREPAVSTLVYGSCDGRHADLADTAQGQSTVL